jgi:hypothetical protein
VTDKRAQAKALALKAGLPGLRLAWGVMARVFVPAVLLALICSGALREEDVGDSNSIGAVFVQNGRLCPVVIWSIWPGSPASRAGLRVGDELVHADGEPAKSLGIDGLVTRIRSEKPGPIRLGIRRNSVEQEAVLERVRFSGILAGNRMKSVDDALVPADTADEEVRATNAFDVRRITGQVFPLHYPADPALYFGGFEVFVLKEPDEVTVGGIEPGPGSRAGLHWGDAILSVNGMPVAGKVAGKSVTELEGLFSSRHPGAMRLQVKRVGRLRKFKLETERASDVLRRNGRRILDGRVVPIGVSDEAARCQ